MNIMRRKGLLIALILALFAFSACDRSSTTDEESSGAIKQHYNQIDAANDELQSILEEGI